MTRKSAPAGGLESSAGAAKRSVVRKATGLRETSYTGFDVGAARSGMTNRRIRLGINSASAAPERYPICRAAADDTTMVASVDHDEADASRPIQSQTSAIPGMSTTNRQVMPSRVPPTKQIATIAPNDVIDHSASQRRVESLARH